MAEPDRFQEESRVLGRFSVENPNPVLRTTNDGVLLYANHASQSVLSHFDCRIGQGLPGPLRQFITDVLSQGKPHDLELSVAGRCYSFTVTPIRDAECVFLYGHDITRLKETEQELVRLKDEAQARALHDPLTGLPNRVLLEDRLRQAIARSERNRRKLAVVLIDLDDFKQVNDRQGHWAGDQVLVGVATRLRQAVRKSDTVARWGGDEMVLVLPDIHGHKDARLICERVRNAARLDIPNGPVPTSLTLSMGVALYPDDALEPEILLRLADAALYRAKSQGRNTTVFTSQPD